MQANAPAAPLSTPLLEIRGLKTHFSTDDGIVQAVEALDPLTVRVTTKESLAISRRFLLQYLAG